LKVIFFLGYTGSGKTTAIECVARGLTKSGWKVGTLKHIHDPTFTIDTPGKDTWRHANSGASVVIALAPNEMTMIKKCDTINSDLDGIMRIFKEDSIDYVLVEGLHREFNKRRGNGEVLHIICSATEEDLLELLKRHPQPICIAGVITSVGKFQNEEYLHGIPLVRFPEETSKVLRMLD
jgi:molybdopterin-guanine dinucleotide biosynthesis protein MobB